MARKTRQVSSSVATVIPEIGFDDEPISPVSREETVTNRKPKMMISRAPSRFHCRWSWGTSMIDGDQRDDAADHELERHVLVGAQDRRRRPAAPVRPRKSARPPLRPCQIVGSERNRLMMPPAATAPAPM